MYPLFGRGAPYIIYADLYRFILSWNGPQVNRLSRISENNLHFPYRFHCFGVNLASLPSLNDKSIVPVW